MGRGWLATIAAMGANALRWTTSLPGDATSRTVPITESI